MSNHYHLLLENSRENLSAGMRQINSTYAKYYNKKYKRSGHFWQGRFKSRYVFGEFLRPCMSNSFILQWYDSTTELLKAVGLKMSVAEFEKIEQFQKDSITYKTNPKKVEQKLKLENYFYDEMSKIDRNDAILKAYQDGFMQSEIAKSLKLTGAGVNKILKKLRINS